jgi:hypothetical protein
VAAQATQPAPPTQPVAPTPPTETPEQVSARQVAERTALEAKTKGLFDELVRQYTLPDDMAARLPTEPEQVLPFLAAKVHQHVMAQVEQMVARELPGRIHQVVEFGRKETEAKNAFYSAWPTLNPAEHHEKVMMIGALFRQMNPSATAEEAIQRIGRVVHEALGMPLPVATPKAPPQAPPPPAPQPFRPAGGSGGGRAATAPVGNDFEQMAHEFLLEDQG